MQSPCSLTTLAARLRLLCPSTSREPSQAQWHQGKPSPPHPVQNALSEVLLWAAPGLWKTKQASQEHKGLQL